ncbi:hypothetical protein PoB_004480600 [Plakobranchus ocellatus]|uniref:Uncharacterized protein n=1 Tax=Plakobranchus ocellatus TaxID=259542 RepID=A0AAV4BHG2_9GAST|nr:hypothetical protein PoB_004480600 [Plakobranchus ocellatus]
MKDVGLVRRSPRGNVIVRTILEKAVPSSSPSPPTLRPSWESRCSIRTISEQTSSSGAFVGRDGCGESPPFSRSSSTQARLSVSLSRDKLEDAMWWRGYPWGRQRPCLPPQCVRGDTATRAKARVAAL